MFADERYVTRAVKAGASGYLLKDSVEGDLLKSIRAIHLGQAFFCSAVARILLDQCARDLKGREVVDCYDLLTDRERQIYQLLAEGNSNKDIANRLKLSLHTVETHRTRVMEKLGVHSTAELVLSAVRRGLVT